MTYSKSDRLWGLKWLKVKVRLTIPLGTMENTLTLIHNDTIKISKRALFMMKTFYFHVLSNSLREGSLYLGFGDNK